MELRKITGKGKAYDHLGNEHNCFADMCRYYGFKPQVVYQRLSYGYSLEKALTTPPRCQVEFKGVIYSSFKELCRKFHINAHSVKTRLKLGWPLEKALTVPIKFYNQQIVYKGFRYRSKKSLCDAFNISRTTLDKYLLKGMTPDEAVDILIKKQNIAVGDMVFKNHYEISKLFNVSISNVYCILKASNVPEARLLMLQKTSERKQHNENYWIFNGEKVNTINELAKIMDMSISWCSQRLSKYKDCKTDLFLPDVDYEGNKFKNFKAMCKHYKIKVYYAMERYWQTKDIKKTLCS